VACDVLLDVAEVAGVLDVLLGLLLTGASLLQGYGWRSYPRVRAGLPVKHAGLADRHQA